MSSWLPWLITIAFALLVFVFVEANRVQNRVGVLVFLVGPAVFVAANAWCWLAPMRGSHGWTWLPWCVLALAWVGCRCLHVDADFPAGRLFDLCWPPTLAVLVAPATFAGALRRASHAEHERPLSEVALRIVVAASTLLLLARLSDLNAARHWFHGGPAFADIAPRSVIESAGYRLTCHALVAALVPAVVYVHRDRLRAAAVLFPTLGFAALGGALLVLDLLELDAARRTWPAPIAEADIVVLELEAWASRVLGGLALAAIMMAGAISASFRVVARGSPLLVGWARTRLLLVVALLSTSAVLAPRSDGPSQSPARPEALGADATFSPIVGEARDENTELVSYDGTVTGIGVLTQAGALRTVGDHLASVRAPAADWVYPGRPYNRSGAEIVVDRRTTLDQLIRAAQQLRAFEQLVVVWRTRADLHIARAAREQWGFVERASRSLGGRSIELIDHAEGCAAPEVRRGAVHTRCARHDGLDEEVLVLRGGDLTVEDWLATRTEADRWIAIEVDRTGVVYPWSDELVWPHDPPEPTHQLSAAWPWLSPSAALFGVVIAFLCARRRARGQQLPRWVEGWLGITSRRSSGPLGPYRGDRDPDHARVAGGASFFFTFLRKRRLSASTLTENARGK
ncbi:MAG: hypothetical protein J0L92_01995 [Deltaproteobacteria bacterium]|nr:hypothetical protein [Deltaproteobacteria bacterium]